MNKEVLLKDLGEKIRIVRKDKGITQVQLATPSEKTSNQFSA